MFFPNKFISQINLCSAANPLSITLPQEEKVLPAEMVFDSPFLDWVPQAAGKAVYFWSGLVNKERQKRREGLHGVNNLSDTLIFMEIRSAVPFFDVKTNPCKVKGCI